MAGFVFSLVRTAAARTTPSTTPSRRLGRRASSTWASSADAMTSVTSGSMIPMPSWTRKNGTTTARPAATSPVRSPPSLRASNPITATVASPAPTDTARIAVSGLTPSSTSGSPSHICSGSRPISSETKS